MSGLDMAASARLDSYFKKLYAEAIDNLGGGSQLLVEGRGIDGQVPSLVDRHLRCRHRDGRVGGDLTGQRQRCRY